MLVEGLGGEEDYGFAVFGVRAACDDDGGVEVLREEGFDFFGLYLYAACTDDVVFASAHDEASLGVELYDVVGVEGVGA